ncbi:MAG: hypothetical protein ACXACX_10230 [Candidatus Hodarchaeales archaeon]|jgi:predicted nucleic acid-binding Zn ribbon protein
MAENTLGPFQRKNIHYLDIVFACLHFLIIIFLLIIVSENIVLTILGCSFTVMYLAAIIYTFIKNNPFYIFYCYGFFLCALFYLISSFLFAPLFGLILFPELFYFYILMKFKRPFETVEGYVKLKRHPGFTRRYRGREPFGISDAKDIINPENKLKIEKQKEIFNKEFKVKRIRLISIFLVISLFIILILLQIVIRGTYEYTF